MGYSPRGRKESDTIGWLRLLGLTGPPKRNIDVSTFLWNQKRNLWPSHPYNPVLAFALSLAGV